MQVAPTCKGNSVNITSIYILLSTFAVGNGITKIFFGLVMVLPTRKFFGNPASQTKTEIFGE